MRANALVARTRMHIPFLVAAFVHGQYYYVKVPRDSNRANAMTEVSLLQANQHVGQIQ